MLKTIDWTAWNQHHKMTSLCRGEEKTLSSDEIDEANRLIREINERIDSLNAIFALGVQRFAAR